MRRLLLLSICLSLLLCLCACGGGGATPGTPAATRSRPAVQSGEVQFSPPSGPVTDAVLHTTAGDIRVRLYPGYAPMATENFLGLARQGYYDGTPFHRVVQDFVVQGGDASGTGTGGESIWGRPFFSEYSPRLHHYAGAVCMAAADGQADTHLSQFYIVAAPAGNLDEEALAALAAAGVREEVVETYRQAGGLPYLDYTDTVFGQVVEGMDVVDRIAAGETDEEGRPSEPVTLLSVTVEEESGEEAAQDSSV
ncbi:peptidylprolyl isomerase [Ruminococcaceae bacterium OttesenSCG-928-I18]|nr:peptidylprolyl isomerase [Ruminococcaceae bacterium OttesenSCG-928-I18]